MFGKNYSDQLFLNETIYVRALFKDIIQWVWSREPPTGSQKVFREGLTLRALILSLNFSSLLITGAFLS